MAVVSIAIEKLVSAQMQVQSFAEGRARINVWDGVRHSELRTAN